MTTLLFLGGAGICSGFLFAASLCRVAQSSDELTEMYALELLERRAQRHAALADERDSISL